MKKNIILLFLLLFFTIESFSQTNSKDQFDVNENKLPLIFYSYEIDGFGKFKVYVKIKDNFYVLFNVEHEVLSKEFKNLWRVKEGHLCAFDNNQMIPLYRVLTSGENEFVWFSDRPNVSEAIGGLHGNERIDLDTASYIHFYADNRRVNLSKDIPLTSCQFFSYSQRSTMHQAGTGGLIYSPNYVPIKSHPIECYHHKETTFGHNGYRVYNKVIWTDNKAPVKKVYYGIYCVDKNVSKYGYNDIPNTSKNVIEFIDDGVFKLKSPNQRVVMYNDSLNVSVTCDSKIIRGRSFQLNTSILDHKIYHKYYSAIENKDPIKVMDGETWEMESYIQFNLNAKSSQSY